MTIYIAIRTAPKQVLVRLRSRNPMEGDGAAATLADTVALAVERHLDVAARTERPPAPSCGARPPGKD